MSRLNIQKYRNTCDLMHRTGADDSQYILVSLRDLEELLDRAEGKEVKDAEEDTSGEKEENRKDIEKDRPCGDPQGQGDRKMGHCEADG